MIVQVLVGTSAALLGVAALLTLIRLVRGPSGLDRGVASDVFVAILVAAIGLWTIAERTPVALGLLVVLSLVGFSGTVALARLITTSRARERRFQEARVDDAYGADPGRAARRSPDEAGDGGAR